MKYVNQILHQPIIGLKHAAMILTLAASALMSTSLYAQTQAQTQALDEINLALKNKPRDLDQRFKRAILFVEMGQTQAAIIAFDEMTRDFPAMPEPYNNLAVLYAKSGQTDKARAALEMAVRTDPRYATGFENLGDIYLKLASENYFKALSIDRANEAAQRKLLAVAQMNAQ